MAARLRGGALVLILWGSGALSPGRISQRSQRKMCLCVSVSLCLRVSVSLCALFRRGPAVPRCTSGEPAGRRGSVVWCSLGDVGCRPIKSSEGPNSAGFSGAPPLRTSGLLSPSTSWCLVELGPGPHCPHSANMGRTRPHVVIPLKCCSELAEIGQLGSILGAVSSKLAYIGPTSVQPDTNLLSIPGQLGRCWSHVPQICAPQA